MNKKILRKFYRKLPEKEFEELKKYIFLLQKNRFKRIDLKPKKTSFGILIKKETNKLLYDYLYYLILNQ